MSAVSADFLLALGGAVATLVSGFWAVFVLAGRQFEKRLDERFDAQEQARQEGRRIYEQRLQVVEESHRDLERAYLRHLADLPREYMRREDHIRFETVIDAKLNALAANLERLTERLPSRKD